MKTGWKFVLSARRGSGGSRRSGMVVTLNTLGRDLVHSRGGAFFMIGAPFPAPRCRDGAAAGLARRWLRFSLTVAGSLFSPVQVSKRRIGGVRYSVRPDPPRLRDSRQRDEAGPRTGRAGRIETTRAAVESCGRIEDRAAGWGRPWKAKSLGVLYEAESV